VQGLTSLVASIPVASILVASIEPIEPVPPMFLIRSDQTSSPVLKELAIIGGMAGLAVVMASGYGGGGRLGLMSGRLASGWTGNGAARWGWAHAVVPGVRLIDRT
jgi:hypothetical protein